MSETNNQKDEFCNRCFLVRYDECAPQDACPNNGGGPHEWTTEPDLTFPTDLDMKSLLSVTDAADIQNMSDEDKAKRRHMFLQAMGRMLGDAAGASAEEREAIREGYAELLSSIMPNPSGSVPHPGIALRPTMPPELPKLPTPPSPLCIEVTSSAVTTIDFSELIGPGLVGLQINLPHTGKGLSLSIEANCGVAGLTTLNSYASLHLLLYLRDNLAYLRELMAAYKDSGAYYAAEHTDRRHNPKLVAEEISAILAVPAIQSILADYDEGTRDDA